MGALPPPLQLLRLERRDYGERVAFTRRRPTAEELHHVYRAHAPAVYGFFSYSVGVDAAEDLTATTFERVIRAWSRYDASRSAPRTWILAIARNVLTDHYRRQRHRAGPSLDEHPALADRLSAVDDPAARRLGIEGAKAWLGRLSPREQEVIALRYGAELPTADIARALDLSEANVNQISSRALRRLRDLIGSTEVSRGH